MLLYHSRINGFLFLCTESIYSFYSIALCSELFRYVRTKSLSDYPLLEANPKEKYLTLNYVDAWSYFYYSKCSSHLVIAWQCIAILSRLSVYVYGAPKGTHPCLISLKTLLSKPVVDILLSIILYSFNVVS